MQEHAVDVRDAAGVRDVLRSALPEIVFHMAAQPMVRRSLKDPALTYEVNVMGTVNVLDAIRLAEGDVRAVVVVTSDKCYENSGDTARRFAEGDPLGGADPYSSSKACAELLTGAYRSSFFSAERSPGVASARAGNVIGGGDWGEDRLLADVVRAIQSGEPVRLRNPQAVRPWQHVLNPLSGYLRLAERLYQRARWRGRGTSGPRPTTSRACAGSWSGWLSSGARASAGSWTTTSTHPRPATWRSTPRQPSAGSAGARAGISSGGSSASSNGIARSAPEGTCGP